MQSSYQHIESVNFLVSEYFKTRGFIRLSVLNGTRNLLFDRDG